MENNLCCHLSPVVICEGCDSKWCDPCSNLPSTRHRPCNDGSLRWTCDKYKGKLWVSRGSNYAITFSKDP
jgi:hypothetical protein